MQMTLFLAIAGKYSIVLSQSITLKDIIHVSNLSYSLMSVNKLSQEKHCQTKFFCTRWVFQDLNSGKMIGNAKENWWLYCFGIGVEYLWPFKQINSRF